MRRSSILVFICAVAIAAGCDRGDTTRAADNNPTTPASDAARTGGATTELTAEMREFGQTVVDNGRKEIELAKFVQEKGQAGEVKDFANKLERDHTDVNDRLQRILTSANATPSTVSNENEKMTKLQNMTGAELDRAWIDMMVEDHQKSIDKFEQMSRTATGEMKSFIDDTLPALREHLEKAKALQAKKTLE